MRTHALLAATLTACVAWGLGGGPVARGGGKAAAPGPLVVTDNAGKESKVTNWRFLQGTRHLSWLAPAAAPKAKEKNKDGEKEEDGKAPTGPEALEFREGNSTTYADGILTLVPLTSIKKIDYDNENKTVTVTYLKAGAGGPEEGTLTGSTRYVGVNKLTLEGEADLGELGKAALKYQGGNAKGVRSIQFPAPKAAPAPTGRPAVVTAKDKKHSQHKVVGLEPLYLVGKGEYRLISKLQFKATVKVPLEKLEKLRYLKPEGKEGAILDFEITLKGGQQHTLTLLQNVNPEDGEPARLKGVVGRVAAGYQLFPPHTLEEVRFDTSEVAPPEKGKDAKPKKDEP